MRTPTSMEWYTPSSIIEPARTVLGEIDVDPASSPSANETVRATKFFTVADDGLRRDWPGRVWLNPPYGGQARLFAARLRDQVNEGITTAAILLTSAVPTGDAWFQTMLKERPMCFVGRVRYTNTEGVEKPSMHASVAVYFGPEADRFQEVFDEFGAVTHPRVRHS